MVTLRLAILGLTACLGLFADVSQIFVVRFEPPKDLPPDLAEQVAKQLAGSMDALSLETRIKGSRAKVRIGTFVSLSDFDGALVTVLDRPSKRYSTVSPQEYERAWKSIASNPVRAARPAGGSGTELKVDAKLAPTGRHRKIHGIDTEEVQIAMSAPLSATDRLGVRISLWVPVQSERVRHPALLEMQRYIERAYVSADMMSELTKMFESAGKGLTELVQAMAAAGPYMEMRTTYAIPLPGGEMAFEMVQELIEFSTDEIPEQMFAVPRDYAPVSIEELLPAVLASTAPKPGGDVKAPVMRPGTEDPAADADRPKLQRRKP